MNTSPASVVGILDRLSIGVSRTSIRHYAAPKFKKKKPHLTGFTRGHGERIFVYNHIENGMIIYSHEPELKRESQKALSQIPFTVKKQKPAVLRHDYWQPLCMIQFDAGQGVVGRNVFQKLREFRQLHELQWGWQAKELQQLNKRARGERIHDQKPNAVADIAAVLAGAGRGNLMWTLEGPTSPVPAVEEKEAAASEAREEGKEETAAAAPAAEGVDTSEGALTASTTTSAPAGAENTAVAKAPKAGKKGAKPTPSPPKKLLKATIYWANDVDLDWAREWSENVIHEVGLPDGVKVWNWKTKMLREENQYVQDIVPDNVQVEKASKEDGEGTSAEDPKKGWFGWLGGKAGGSSQDARA